jgi:CDP-glucose 4,6-dehydratase
VPRGDGNHVRDFIFVQDVAELYLIIAESLAQDHQLSGQIFNAGTNQPKVVRDIVRMVYEIAGASDKYGKVAEMFQERKTSGEIDVQFMSFDKVREYFKWEPKTEFKDGLKKTIQWYRKYLTSQSLSNSI